MGKRKLAKHSGIAFWKSVFDGFCNDFWMIWDDFRWFWLLDYFCVILELKLMWVLALELAGFFRNIPWTDVWKASKTPGNNVFHLNKCSFLEENLSFFHRF